MAARRTGRASARRPAQPRVPRAPPLPPITMARLREASALIECLIEEKADVFLAAQQRHRERHAAAHPERQLDAQEAAQIAAALITDGEQDRVALAEQVQNSGLRAQDRPAPTEMLLVAGAATAPAVIDIGLRLLALLRIPDDEFKQARKDGYLDEVLDLECERLDDLEAAEARALAAQAFRHLAAAGGAEGNGAGLILQVIARAWGMAAETMGPTLDRLSLSSLTGSPPSTAGRSTTSSTTSTTPTP